MPNENWLIASSYAEPEVGNLGTAAAELGWRVRRVDGPEHVPVERARDRLAVYGDTRFCVEVARRLDRRLIESPLDLLARLPRRFTGRDVQFSRFADVQSRNRPLFVKPADCIDKCFDPKIYQPDEEIRVETVATGETRVLVSDPVRWGDEYRLIIADGQVVDHSPYILGGRIARKENGRWWPDGEGTVAMRDFAADLLSEHVGELPPVCVMDVGWIETHGWAVVEFNPLWCSSLYGCDPRLVVPLLQQGIFPSAEHSPFVVERDDLPPQPPMRRMHWSYWW